MLALLNVLVLLLSTAIFVWSYVRSVCPAALEKEIGPRAYEVCARRRALVIIPTTMVLACYGLYLVYPLEIGLPRWFPWPWWVSLTTAFILSLPFAVIWARALRAAGAETMVPDKEHNMYQGIYTQIRHAQALGEHGIWVLLGLATHSPFLTLYSLIWIPAAVIMCRAEERDLVIRYPQTYKEYMRTTPACFPESWLDLFFPTD